MIGAQELSELAAAPEAAANAKDGDTIRRDHDAMMTKYEIVTGAILQLIPDAIMISASAFSSSLITSMTPGTSILPL